MTMRSKSLWLLLLLAACGRGGERPARVVDSTVPRDVALARFRRDLREVTTLSGGDTERERLVRRFITALERNDTTELRDLILTRAEFAWLYYPTAREANPPYDLAPDLMWFTHEGRSEQGIRVALETRGGRPLGYTGHRCAAEPRLEGENRLYGYCLVRRKDPASGAELEEQLFGLIVERGGIFKFVSYANQLD